MSGDVINIYGKSYYHLNSGQQPNNSYLISGALQSLLGAFASTSAVTAMHSGVTGGVLNNTPQTTTPLPGWLNGSAHTPLSNVPKAYINWLFLDEQFKPVTTGMSGASPVATTSDKLKSHSISPVSITKNGYLYVYCSNESNIDVFFDNLQVVHTRGPLVSEDHYYPFGLTMNGISSQALNFGSPENNRLYNKGSELQHHEFSDGSGLELYSTEFRSLDPQLGRWWQIDPKPDYAQSLYSAMGNNPISFTDPLGDTARIQFSTGFLGLGGKKQADYNNGKITNTDGSAYTGKVKGYLKQAVTGLNELSAGGSTGKGLVNDIVNSTQTVNIIKGDNSFNAVDKATGMTNVVRWDPSNTNGGPDAALSQSRPAFIGLGHELAHAQDQVFDNSIDYKTWYTTSGGINIPNAEIYSTHMENLIRTENGVNLRAFYSLYTNPAGVTIGERQVLLPGTRQNANTITANGLNLVNPIY